MCNSLLISPLQRGIFHGYHILVANNDCFRVLKLFKDMEIKSTRYFPLKVCSHFGLYFIMCTFFRSSIVHGYNFSIHLCYHPLRNTSITYHFKLFHATRDQLQDILQVMDNNSTSSWTAILASSGSLLLQPKITADYRLSTNWRVITYLPHMELF